MGLILAVVLKDRVGLGLRFFQCFLGGFLTGDCSRERVVKDAGHALVFIG